MISFLEFTTGGPHPRSSEHTVALLLTPSFCSKKLEVEVLGDHILVTSVCEEWAGQSELFVVSWKTGKVTHVSGPVAASLPLLPPFEPSFVGLSHYGTAEGRSHRSGK